jgi:ergothioneine biosynthesis glutamate--cysteine ligase EgtA
MMHLLDDEEHHASPLSSRDAWHKVHGIGFKTGPPGVLGVELEWLVCEGNDPVVPVSHSRVLEQLAALDQPGALPGHGRLTVEPGGQVELSSAPAAAVGECVAAACRDLSAMRAALSPAGLTLVGRGIDPYRPPSRVLDLPRYAAMEEFFDRGGPWGRLMMCSTASVQVCVDAGEDRPGETGYRFRWRLVHALGPVLVSAFANSPLRDGRPTGWKSTRQAVWSRLDPGRTMAPAGAEPPPGGPVLAGVADIDPRDAWADYTLDAQVMCMRRDDAQHWRAPAGLTFRDWLNDASNCGGRRPTADDLDYHVSTLFPPVRPRGHLELRMIDAQPADGWIVPAALVAALVDDSVAARQAVAAVEPVWRLGADRGAGTRHPAGPWITAARQGPADPVLAQAGLDCFEAAAAALARAGAPAQVREAVTWFTERYAARGRCPADDMLEEMQ